MNIQNWVLKHKRLLVVSGVLLLASLLFYGAFQEGSVGYLSGSQGLNVEFHSLRYKNYWWSTTEQGPATAIWSDYPTVAEWTKNPALTSPSIKSFGSTMDFDPDGASTGMADILASTQVMTRQSETPMNTYLWSVEGGTYTTSDGKTLQKSTQFEMYRYRMDWAMNLWLSGPESESDGWVYTNNWGVKYYLPDNNYGSSELWIKLEPTNFVYFTENPDVVYFAPCYIALSEPAQFIGLNPDGTETKNDADMQALIDIIPEATGEALGVYYKRGAEDIDLSTSELLSYKGYTLDPQIFRDEYWTRINLVNFVPKSWWNFLSHGWKYPSVYLHFVVDVFVVGQWTVYYETGEVPELEGHDPTTQYDFWTSLAAGIANVFGSPTVQLWLVFILVVLVLVVVTWRNPHFWNYLLKSRRRKSVGGGGKRG